MVTDTATETFANAILDLANRVETLIQLQASRHDSRILIALAGVPGSGKSTLSQALLAELASRQIDHVSVVPMVRLSLLRQSCFNKLTNYCRMGFIIPRKC